MIKIKITGIPEPITVCSSWTRIDNCITAPGTDAEYTMFILDNTSRAVIQSKFQINDDNSQLASKAKWNKMEKVENLFNFKHTHTFVCICKENCIRNWLVKSFGKMHQSWGEELQKLRLQKVNFFLKEVLK